MFGRFSELREIRERLTRIEDIATAIERQVGQIMATQADLDQALDALDAQLKSSSDTILAAVNDILKKVPPAIDLSAEVGRIQGVASGLQSTTEQVKALDVTPPPAAAKK